VNTLAESFFAPERVMIAEIFLENKEKEETRNVGRSLDGEIQEKRPLL
jgi:hypothetical protein